MKSISLAAAMVAIFLSAALHAAPININAATANDIAQSLSGVGINKAQAIVEFRKQNGKFKAAADIVQVKGIGNSTYEKNKDDILIK